MYIVPSSLCMCISVCGSIDVTFLLLLHLHHLLQCNPLQICLNISNMMLVLQLLLNPMFAGTQHGFWWEVAVIEGMKLSEIMHPSTGILPPWLVVVMMMYVATASRNPLVATSSTSSKGMITKQGRTSTLCTAIVGGRIGGARPTVTTRTAISRAALAASQHDPQQ
mmetsp:Transcript_7903/g.12785  ORF Transcript_7903/g.12785 Transcript_7903/m.12785 type:complete len:166 (-) Transcript_7903:807-1304(-)